LGGLRGVRGCAVIPRFFRSKMGFFWGEVIFGSFLGHFWVIFGSFLVIFIDFGSIKMGQKMGHKMVIKWS
jgi:hypothetical protein